MRYEEKTALVEEMHQTFETTPHFVLATFSGLSVNQANALRGVVREAGGTYRVSKNRLTKRAAVGTPLALLVDRLTGPCALATHQSDPVILAKALSGFAEQNPQLQLLAGVIDAKDLIDAGDLKQLATLPGLPELRAQLLALINTPASQLVQVLNAPGGQLARVIDARREQLEGAS